MNEEFPPEDQPDARMFFVRHVEGYLSEWVKDHPDPRQVEEPPKSETDSEEEREGGGGDNDDDNDSGDENRGSELVTEEASGEQGEDGQHSQGAQDAGDQNEEGEDSEADEEGGRRCGRRAGGECGAADARKANKKLPKREQ